ncbi:hypothetical protein NDU88_003917 [Pleurodeles waltl]|uniref:Uncharacterized protein n=1 Tax=Pleurodeles waltl TaxID=8319 RepID=A0AAV7MRZ0_PLEWA|nr:hypothetical protein NDU88_003917 [Pleurodeles waltl]
MPLKPKGGLGEASKDRHTIEEGLAKIAHNTIPNEEFGMGDPSSSTNLALKNLILEGNKAITEKIDGVAITMVLLKQDIDKMRDRMRELG